MNKLYVKRLLEDAGLSIYDGNQLGIEQVFNDRSDCIWKINDICRRHVDNNECQPIDIYRCNICNKYKKNPNL